MLGASDDCNHRMEGRMRKKYGVIFAVIGYIILFSYVEGWTDWKNFVTTGVKDHDNSPPPGGRGG